jgi:hypothetical protein
VADSTNIVPIQPLDEASSLAWLKSQPSRRTYLSAAELARRWGWPRYTVSRKLQCWDAALGINSARLHAIQAGCMVALCLCAGLFISLGAGLIWPKPR